jgi:hypothetical protein
LALKTTTKKRVSSELISGRRRPSPKALQPVSVQGADDGVWARTGPYLSK